MPDDGVLARSDSYRSTEGRGSPVDLGGVSISINDQPLEATEDEDGGVTLAAPAIREQREDIEPANFGENLALRMSDGQREQLAHEVHEGVEADMESRKGFVQNMVNGLDLLGLEIETEGATQAQKRSISRVRHPVLLEAIVKAQSQARAELYPAEGPVKAKVRGQDTDRVDELAQAFEKDFNWYLTEGAKEYVPDGDRGLFGFFYSGNCVRKVYEHELRKRPVADSIGIENFIVSEDACDLDTALRVTHRNPDMPLPLVKRMQRFGGWLDIDLSSPSPLPDQFRSRLAKITGKTPMTLRPQDVPYTIDETIVDLDLEEYGIRQRGIPDGLPVSYAVTQTWDNPQVLAVHRRWKFGDKMFQRKHPFVHYQMIPSFGFLALGYVHLLGNQAKALTAIWRVLCDAGLFSNFPGGIRAKGVRLGTNEVSPNPGEWPDIDIGAFDDIKKALMPMPYAPPNGVFIQLAEIIGQDAQRLAGAVDLQVGEGRTNIPVGTMLAMVEQSTQTMAAVHKRMHTAQARELLLLKECFAENPEALWKLNPDPAKQWQSAQEFADLEIAPASDPNVPAQIHRIMIALALVTMASQNPDIYDRVASHIRAWGMIGVGDAQSFVREPPPQTDPSAGAAQATLAAKQMDIQAKTQENERKAAEAAVEAKQRSDETQVDAANDAADRASQERIAAMREQTERIRLAAEEHRAARQEAQADRHHVEQQMTAGLTAEPKGQE